MQSALKRAFDVAGAAIGLVVCGPVIALVALFVWIDSPGPVIFSQERLGKGGRRFRMHKFRKFPHSLNGGPIVTVQGDARMTKFGAFIERTKLDELPQLWNILKGDMSFVGPRPETPKYECLFNDGFKKLLEYTPGVFGPNQVAYRNESELYPPDEDPEEFYLKVLFPDKAKRDLEYFQRANFVSDVKWIINGIFVSFVGVVNWRSFFKEEVPLMAMDASFCALAWTLAHFLRHGGVPDKGVESYLWGMLVFPVIVVSGMLLSGLYRRLIDHFSFTDIIQLAQVISVSWLIGVFIHMGFLVRSSSIFIEVVGGLLALNFVALPRLWRRYYSGRRAIGQVGEPTKLVIYGASACGLALAHWVELENNGYRLIGFLDDSKKLRNCRISGHPVLGGGGNLKCVHAAHTVNEVWLSVNLHSEKGRRFERLCDELDINVVNFSEMYPFAQADNHHVPGILAEKKVIE